jgi:hypothetical protein
LPGWIPGLFWIGVRPDDDASGQSPSVVRLDLGIAGTLVFVSKLAAAAIDPLMGVISDRARFRRGRRPLTRRRIEA